MTQLRSTTRSRRTRRTRTEGTPLRSGTTASALLAALPVPVTSPAGTFELTREGRVVEHCSYDGVPQPHHVGLDLFADVLEDVSPRDAAFLAEGFERATQNRDERLILQGRELALVLVHHPETATYRGFLGPV